MLVLLPAHKASEIADEVDMQRLQATPHFLLQS
jgi:hypothetical protein